MDSPLRGIDIIPLGGLGEIGLNMLLFHCKDEILIVDCGLMFPEAEHLGVDMVIPDFSYLLERKEQITGVLLTHGHEDHIGALPWFFDQVGIVPVYGTPLTLGLVEAKLREFKLDEKADLRPFLQGDSMKIGSFAIDTVAVSHSIPDGVGLGIETPHGFFVHSGDFKIDETPVDGAVTDMEKFRSFGDRGVTALLSDSTNSERRGRTPSETSLRPFFQKAVGESRGRVIVATFASHLHRIQQIVDAASEAGKRVHFNGRSMVAITAVAERLGYLKIPSGIVADTGELHTIPHDRTVILTTGSQGEPLSALSRIAVNNHKRIRIEEGDRVIISARVIPGREKAISRTINNLFLRGAEVLYNQVADVHVSGHAGREELAELIRAVRPRHLIPIHGEHRHLAHHAACAAEESIPMENVLLAKSGDRLHFERDRGSISGYVTAGRVLIDGKGYGNIHDGVLKDRRKLAREGFLIVIVGINRQTGEIVSGPEIIARGIAYEDESGPLLEEAGRIVTSVLQESEAELRTDWGEAQIKVRKALRRFFDRKMERRPLIIPAIIEV